MEFSKNRTILLSRMDKAFRNYSYEAEKLSVLLGLTRPLQLVFLSRSASAKNRGSRARLTSNIEKYRKSCLR